MTWSRNSAARRLVAAVNQGKNKGRTRAGCRLVRPSFFG
jgi:hypothetical protein